jgi:glycerophosphoryl diester phosphodiesterase
MRHVLTAAAAAALIAAMASPAVAAPENGAGTPSSNAAGAATSALNVNERNGSFDLQSHRGGRGEWTEESLTAFANSLKLGVTTLELDTHLTDDGKVIVWHDDTIQANKCVDTAPATAGDPEFPYVGDRVAELSLAQVKTLDCGFMQLPGYPDQDVIEGNRIAELKDVYQLARDTNAAKVRFNVETKVNDSEIGGAGMESLTRADPGGTLQRRRLDGRGPARQEPQPGRHRHRRLQRFASQGGSRPGVRRRLPHVPFRHPCDYRRSP